MACAYLYGWVSTELPGYRQIETDDGTQTAAPGVYEFRDWVAALDASGTAGVVFDSDAARVTVTPTSGPIGWADAAGDALGFGAEPGSFHPVDGAVTAPGPSMLAIPLMGCRWERVAADREGFSPIDRKRRANGYTFGFARIFTVELTMNRAAFDAFARGWVQHGRVTIEGSDPVAVGPANPGGTLIGTVLGIDSSGWVGPRRDVADIRLTVAEESGALPSVPWQRALALGYGQQFEAVIEGIRPTITEHLSHHLSTDKAVAADGVSQALSLDGQGLSWEVDRDTGVAGGRNLEIVYAYDTIEAEGLGELFQRPPNTARLTANLEPGDVVCTVDDTTGFDASGTIYIGREVITYAALTATTFTGLVRGIDGYVQRHLASAVGIYAEATDRVSIWRGRLVTLWAHLTSPDGRLLITSWDSGETESDTRRIEWRGVVSEPPQPAGSGMRLVARLLERLLERPIGSDVEFTTLDESSQYIVAAPGEQLTVGIAYDITVSSGKSESYSYALLAPDAAGQVFSLDEWGAFVESELRSQLIEALDAQGQAGAIGITFNYVAAGSWFSLRTFVIDVDVRDLTVFVTSQVSFINPLIGHAGPRARIATAVGTRAGQWLVLTAETDDNVLEIPASGLLLCTSGGAREVIAYDSAQVSGERVLMRVTNRHVSTTRSHGDAVTIGLIPGVSGVDLGKPEVSCRLVFGFGGTVGGSALTMLESSGTALRGDYDTGLLSFGLGLPSGWIDEAAMLAGPVGATAAFVFGSNESTVQELVGGWFAVHRRAIVSRRVAGLGYRLTVVDTEPAPGAALARQSIALSPTATPALIEAPNCIEIDGGGATLDEFITTVIDRPRVQQEGEIKAEYSVPGLIRIGALGAATSIMRRGLGQATIDVVWPSWAEPRPGDPVTVTLGHPRTWDWATGTRAPVSLAGRIVSVRRDVDTWAVSGEVLLEGRLGPAVFISPTAWVRAGTTGTSLFVDLSDAPSFAVLEEVTLYTPGDEAAEYADMTVIGVDEETGELSLSGSVPVWTTIDETRVTFARYGLASTRQRDGFSFVRTDREWS